MKNKNKIAFLRFCFNEKNQFTKRQTDFSLFTLLRHPWRTVLFIGGIMIRCEIIANQSVQEEITVLLEEKVPDIQYTIVPLVTGRGKNSYKLGNSTWPETNFLLISYIDDKDLSMVKAVVSAVKQKFTGEGIELFCVKSLT